MPPVPPARRQAASPPAATRPLSLKHQRFLRLLSACPEHPNQALSQAAFDALPQRCRLALQWAATDEHIDRWTRAALEAYYASGHTPLYPHGLSTQGGAWDYTEDARRATALMNAPDGQISTFLSVNPAMSDINVVLRLQRLLDEPEPRPGDKVRLEALRLLLQLRGHLRDEKSQAIQATQIVIHTSQAPAGQPTEQSKGVDIEL